MKSQHPLKSEPLPVSAFHKAWRAKASRLWLGEIWSLYLHGSVGTGKTYFAELFYREWITPGNLGYFVAPDVLVRHIRDLETWSDYQEYWGRHQYCGKSTLLVLDDVGSHRSTPHLTEQLTMLLLRRHRENSRTIITTNLSVEEFAAAVDPRIASRLQEGEIINTGTKDLRKAT